MIASGEERYIDEVRAIAGPVNAEKLAEATLAARDRIADAILGCASASGNRGPDVFEVLENKIIVIEGASWTSPDAKSAFDALLQLIESRTDEVMGGSRFMAAEELMRRKARAYRETLAARKEAFQLFTKHTVPTVVVDKPRAGG